MDIVSMILALFDNYIAAFCHVNMHPFPLPNSPSPLLSPPPPPSNTFLLIKLKYHYKIDWHKRSPVIISCLAQSSTHCTKNWWLQSSTNNNILQEFHCLVQRADGHYMNSLFCTKSKPWWWKLMTTFFYIASLVPRWEGQTTFHLLSNNSPD